MAKNRLGYAACLVAAFFFYVFYVYHISFFLFLFFLLLPVLTGLIGFLSSRKLTVRTSFDQTTVQRDQPLLVEVQVERKWSIFPIQLQLKMTVINEMTGVKEKEQIVLPVGSRKQSVEMTILGHNCGEVTIVFKQVASLDILGIFAFPVKLVGQKRENVWIFPVVIPVEEIEERPTSNVGDYDLAALRPGNEVPEVYDFREYQPGDRPSRINWKLSSRTDEEVWIKRYSAAVPYMLVILDLFEGEALDPTLDVAASLALELLEENHPATFLWTTSSGGASVRMDDEEGYQLLFQEILAVPFPKKSVTLPEMEQEGAIGAVVCVTSRADSKMFYYLATTYEGASISVLQVNIHAGAETPTSLYAQAENVNVGLQVVEAQEPVQRKEGKPIEKKHKRTKH